MSGTHYKFGMVDHVKSLGEVNNQYEARGGFNVDFLQQMKIIVILSPHELMIFFQRTVEILPVIHHDFLLKEHMEKRCYKLNNKDCIK